MINAKNYNQDPGYLKALIKSAGLSQAEVCRQLAIPDRSWRNWMNKEHPSRHTYCVQVAVETLIKEKKK